jgi:hypothetical protein
MKITNKFNIPETFVNIMRRPTYNKGKANLSVTQLINSPKIVALTNKFDNELESDVSERVWSIFGSAIHQVLEHGKDKNHLIEERLQTELDGYVISGAIDLQIIHDYVSVSIRDYKTTSVWAVMNEKREWEEQLNIYAWLVEVVKKLTVKDIGIVAIIRDWNRRDAATREGYPEAPIKELPIKLWSFEEREAFVKARIHEHAVCEFAMDTEDKLPDCTPSEMWEKPTVYALTKKGNVRAKSLHETPELAQAALEAAGKDYEVIVRPGERTRCANFCQVSAYCQQWRDFQEGWS